MLLHSYHLLWVSVDLNGILSTVLLQKNLPKISLICSLYIVSEEHSVSFASTVPMSLSVKKAEVFKMIAVVVKSGLNYLIVCYC